MLESLRTFNFYIGMGIAGLIILYALYGLVDYSNKAIKEHGLASGIYLSVALGVEILLAIGIFFILPEYIARIFNFLIFPAVFRWSLLLIIGFFWFNKRGISRGIKAFLGTYSLLLFSWLVLGWLGIIFIAFPILAVFLFTSVHIAQALVPAYNINDKQETFDRVVSFLSYLIGVNQPFWKSPSPTAREVDKRINGENPPFPKLKSPIWTYPHQVTGILKGKEFKVRGPGLIFLEKGEMPFELVDLRYQTRKSTIKAASREGIQLGAEISVTFCIDSKSYSRDEYLRLKSTNVLLGRVPDANTNGIFPYSTGRVKSVLSLRSTKVSENGEEITEYWDEHVNAMAEQAAREVLSQRSVEELWRARVLEDQSANEEITGEMRNLLEEQLQRLGIHLVGVKASNFTFIEEKEKNKEDEIVNLQLSAWSVEWEKRQSIQRADVEAEAERIQREARIYAHSALLTAIADGLQQARELHPNLPRYIIALRFLGTLETMLEGQAGEDSQKALNQLHHARQSIISRQGGD